MNREVEGENRMLKEALEEATKEIESKMEKIAQLEDLEKVGSCQFLYLHCLKSLLVLQSAELFT